jgi:hypothetical protein
MPDSAREGRWSPFSHWETLSDEVVRYQRGQVELNLRDASASLRSRDRSERG